MSWQYFLVPVPVGATFPAEALGKMDRWWDRHPVYRRSDGAIAICRDVEYRDYVVGVGNIDRIDANLEVVKIESNRITFGILGWQDRIDVIYDFIAFCQSHWPCELIAENEMRRMTAEEYREAMHKTFDYPK